MRVRDARSAQNRLVARHRPVPSIRKIWISRRGPELALGYIPEFTIDSARLLAIPMIIGASAIADPSANSTPHRPQVPIRA